MIDFNTAACGDNVYSVAYGEGIVCAVYKSGINVRFVVDCTTIVLSYSFDGRCLDDRSKWNRTLYWDVPAIDPPKRKRKAPPKDTLVMVWDHDPNTARVRYATGTPILHGMVSVYINGTSSVTCDSKETVYYMNWKLYE